MRRLDRPGKRWAHGVSGERGARFPHPNAGRGALLLWVALGHGLRPEIPPG